MRKVDIFVMTMLTLGLMSCGNASQKNEAAVEVKDSLVTDSSENNLEAVDSVVSLKNTVIADSGKNDSEAAFALLSPGDEAQVKAFLQNFYESYILYNQVRKEGPTYEEVVQAYCTPKLQKYLEEQYEYDCMDAPCYDVSSFRTGMQDGPTDENEVSEIVSEGDGWYRVSFLDMGNPGRVRIHFVTEGDALRMDEVQRL